MNLSTYQNLIEKVGLSKLDDANKETYNIVKEGSANFSDPNLWNEMLADADIKEAYELHVKALERLAKDEPKAEMRVEKSEPKPARTKKVKAAKVTKAVAVKKSTRKRVKKVVKKAMKRIEKKKEPVKFPVTVKKFSKEIQLIRRMINMDGTRKGIGSLASLDRDLNKTLKAHPDRKPVLREMASRVASALKKATEAGVKEININIDNAFKAKLIKANSPKPKMKVEYLSGPHKKSRSKKKSKEVRVKYTPQTSAIGEIPEVPKPKPKAMNGPLISDKLFRQIDQIDQSVKETFRLNGDLGIFLGDVEEYMLAISIEGDQGAGKTQMAFQIADGFADLNYNVGLFELEMGADSNIVVRMRNQYIKPENIKKIAIAGEAPKGIQTIRDYAKKFGVIVIDSWTKLDVDSHEFDKLRKDFPGTIWIVLFQRNSDKQIRGGTKPLYDAGINIEVKKVDNSFYNNYAVATKNRYGMTGLKYNISRMMIDQDVIHSKPEETEIKEETDQGDFTYLQEL